MDLTLVLNFLKKVTKNNNREWFEANKQLYVEAQVEFLKLVEYIIKEVGKFDSEVGMLEPKKCTYRIYRDIRFSKDKTPYKTHLGAFMAPGGKNSGNAGYYFHIQPGESIVAGGLWHPPKEHVAKIRQEIDYNAGELLKILGNKTFKKYYGAIEGEKLSRAPKGYPLDHPNIEFLKLKDYLVVNKFPDSEIKDASFPGQVVRKLKAMKPFLDYLNVAIS